MKRYLIILLLCNLITGKLLFAQNLGDNQGDYLRIASRAGFTNNDFMNNLWLYRMVNGTGWTSASLFDGISIDISCLVPGVDALTWWQRDPGNEIQSWGTRNSTYMTLKSGKLGLGTTDPKTPLDIQSNQNGWMMSSRVIAGFPGEINGLKFYSGYPGEDKWAGIASVAESQHSNKTGLALFSGMTERVRISGDGNVGIGTIEPGATLEVLGTTKFGGHNANLDVSGNPTAYQNLVGTGKMLIGWNRTAGAGETDFIANEGAGSEGGFAFYSYNNASLEKQLLRVLGNGNVGIGITTPTERLTVNGKIKANEIRVDGQGAPDYIFEDSYKIATLKEIEGYIKANKHLPEIPSAKEFERDGIAVGEMNKLLLKKIEELTLHLIEKDKQYGELLNDVKKQELRLRLLEKKLDK